MADVENPNAVEAEPAECCRWMLTCATGFFSFVLVQSCVYTVENFRPTSKLLGLVAAVLVMSATLLAGWLAVICMILVAEWYQGNPEGGQRFVDGLIQSDRGFFQESIHLYLSRIDDPLVNA
ncbi:unnamed protein product [Alopecurus aequalis]